MNTALDVKTMREEARTFQITGRRALRKALIMRYGSLTAAAESMGAVYQMLIDTLAGRKYIFSIIDALQIEFGLSDQQVVEFWPLVREWPKKSRDN